jgi:GABA(A) receptor-associated protein
MHESQSILAKYPDKIPVIIECKNNDLAKLITKRKFLVPRDINCSHLLVILRNKINLDSSKGLFMFHDNVLLSGTNIIGEIYEKHIRDDINVDDRFLYITLQYESTFGVYE